MRIVFTGHRDRMVNPESLRFVRSIDPDATWVHGGAEGFDTQVAVFAAEYRMDIDVRRPLYDLHGGRAPLIRNDEMLDLRPELVVACWDRRERGGTYYTVRGALQRGLRVLLLHPLPVWATEDMP